MISGENLKNILLMTAAWTHHGRVMPE
jgi:hypothetical protein